MDIQKNKKMKFTSQKKNINKNNQINKISSRK
jgi:hypothetical protein